MVTPSTRMRSLARQLSWRFYGSILFIVLSLWSVLIGIANRQRHSPPIITQMIRDETIVIAVDATFPPFAIDEGQGLAGIDIALGQEIAARLDISVRFSPMGFDGLYDALSNGQVDLIISALVTNPAKANDVRYTQAYFDNGLVLVHTDPLLVDHDDLHHHAVAIEYNSIAHSRVLFWSRRLSDLTIMPYQLPRYGLDALRLGDADGALVDMTSYQLYHQRYPEWQHDFFYVNHDHYRIAVRQDREALWQAVNQQLTHIIADGTMQVIIDEGFSTYAHRD